MAILDWIYPKKCLGCGQGGAYICLDCRKEIGRRGESLAYKGLVRKAIKEVKYRGIYGLVSELVEIWNPEKIGGEVVVTSVPMWHIKKLSRGYNQAELIAREVARRWGVEYLELLIRKRETKTMYGLSRNSRIANVRGAFSVIVQSQLAKNSKIIVLIDDVRTSGATQQECSRLLMGAGWKNVIPMALAS